MSTAQLSRQHCSGGRFSFIGTVAATDMSRATESREAGRVGSGGGHGGGGSDDGFMPGPEPPPSWH
ncbi:hypothetical protein IT575_09075 [bacterium]|nr:hypothetical protein [bacterium]